MKKTIKEESVVSDVKVELTDRAKKAVAAKKPAVRKSVTKIGEPVIVRPEEVKAAEEKKAKAKVVKAPARKKSEPVSGNPADYKTVIKDGVAVAVKKSDLEKQSKKEAPALPAISEDDKKRYSALVGVFRESWTAVEQSTLKAAFALYEINTRGLYRVDGYKNIKEFGEAVFGLSRSMTYNLIDIVGRFGAKVEAGKPVSSIADQYSGFSRSQLGVMVGHTDDELSSITPEMSVRDIKAALKKSKIDDELNAPEDDQSTTGKSGTDDQAPSGEPEFKANLIHEFNAPEQFDNMLADDLALAELRATIRHCLKQGHSVRIMDCFTVKG